MKIWLSNYAPYVFFVLLSLAVLGSGLGGGYLFLIDMPWPEQFTLANYTEFGLRPHYPLTVMFWLLAAVIPSWLVQKLLLISILSGISIGVYKLAKRLEVPQKLAVVSGVLAVINPYVAERLFGGQWLVLAGYAMLPFVVASLIELLKTPTRRRFAVFAALYALYPVVSVHWWYIATPLLLLVATFHAIRSRASATGIVKAMVALGMIFVAVNSFWLFSYGGNEGVISGFGADDFAVFQTRSDRDAGLELTVLNQYGFWNDRAALPRNGTDLWMLYGVVSSALAVAGVTLTLKDRRKKQKDLKLIGVSLAVAAPIASMLALGYGHWLGRIVIDFARILPGFNGLRETAKVIGIISLFVALFAPLGVQAVFKKSNQRKVVWSVFGFLGFIAMSGMLSGGNGQIRAYDYPDGYQAVREQVIELEQPVLALPWKAYLELTFAGNSYAANPAATYFNEQVITSRLIDNNRLDRPNELDTVVLRLPDEQWVSDVKQAGYNYVILLKTDAWKNYFPLLELGEVLYDSDDIALVRL